MRVLFILVWAVFVLAGISAPATAQVYCSEEAYKSGLCFLPEGSSLPAPAIAPRPSGSVAPSGYCDPRKAVCAGQSCDTGSDADYHGAGRATLDGDQKQPILCQDDNGKLVWKLEITENNCSIVKGFPLATCPAGTRPVAGGDNAALDQIGGARAGSVYAGPLRASLCMRGANPAAACCRAATETQSPDNQAPASAGNQTAFDSWIVCSGQEPDKITAIPSFAVCCR
ncbi:MAG: hypothetical protein PHY92_01340 [Alphaproteobacteria bacterium]|nr:hypothetical protein [Alphaproteobacteria bacterium]